MKLIRIIFSITALLLLVCAVAAVSLIMLIDPDKLKPVIAEELKKQTGYEAVMDGKFSWSFYPRVGVKTQHIAFYVPKQSVPFIDLHDVIFVTELTQLIHGNQILRGDIYISNVKLLNIQAQNAHVGVHWQDQVLTLEPITASLYQGSLEGMMHGKSLSILPNWDWDIHVANIQLKPLLQDVNGSESKLKLSGDGQIRLRAATQGKTREQILASLNGTLEFELKDGIVDGIDISYLVKSADAIINKQPLVLPTAMNQTAFDNLTGAAVIKNGVAVIDNLALVSPAFRTNGVGSINLIFNAINLQLRIISQKNTETQWVIPVMVTGNLFSPNIRLDATELNVMIAKEKINQMTAKIREEIKLR